jgi:hypothetical protein
MKNPKKQWSTYSIHASLRKNGKKMAYKNVYTRIKKLENLNLIEKEPDESKYGAIYYKLTTQGLLYQLSRFVNLEDEISDDETLSWSDFLDHYYNNIIIETLLLPYFESETLKHSNITLYFAVLSYLRDCYQLTLDAANRIRRAVEEKNHEDERVHKNQLIDDLRWLAKIFAFRLVCESLRRKGGGVILGKLAKDKRFLEFLADVHRDFDKGFNAVNRIHDKYYSNIQLR